MERRCTAGRTLTAATDGGSSSSSQAAAGARRGAASASAGAFLLAGLLSSEPLTVPAARRRSSAAHTNRRSCGGPSTVEYLVLPPRGRSGRAPSWSSVFESTMPGARVLDPLVEGLDDRRRRPRRSPLEVDGRRSAASSRRRRGTLRLSEMRCSSGPGNVLSRRATEHRPEFERRARPAAPALSARRRARGIFAGRPSDASGKRSYSARAIASSSTGVAEELQALVRGRAVGRPRRMREDLLPALGGKGVDQARERPGPPPRARLH
jgi:hypothetical protein